MQALNQTQRREERKETDSQILYRLSGESNFCRARIKNVSHHGLFMSSDKTLDVGEQIEVIISPFDSDYEPMQVTVEIVHIQMADNSDQNGYGCMVTSSNIIENIDI